jgi:hypothetical protein
VVSLSKQTSLPNHLIVYPVNQYYRKAKVLLIYNFPHPITLLEISVHEGIGDLIRGGGGVFAKTSYAKLKKKLSTFGDAYKNLRKMSIKTQASQDGAISLMPLGIMTLSIMPLSIMPLSIMPLCIMPLSIMKLSIMPLSIVTLSIMSLNIMSLNIMPLSIKNSFVTLSISDTLYRVSLY